MFSCLLLIVCSFCGLFVGVILHCQIDVIHVAWVLRCLKCGVLEGQLFWGTVCQCTIEVPRGIRHRLWKFARGRSAVLGWCPRPNHVTGSLPIRACLQVDWRRCANGDATIVVMAGVQDVTIQYDLGTVLFAVSCLPSSCYSLQWHTVMWRTWITRHPWGTSMASLVWPKKSGHVRIHIWADDQWSRRLAAFRYWKCSVHR